MALLATNRFAGDGTTTSYEFNFVGKYIARPHVKVYQEDNVTKVRTYVSINDSNFLNDTTLRGLPVTPAGSTIVIYRETPKPPLVDFVNGSRFTEYNMDLVARQGLFVAMEALDSNDADARAALLAAIEVVTQLVADTEVQLSEATLLVQAAASSAAAAAASASSVDSAYLRNRDNHTGTQAISTVSGLQAALNDKQASLGFTPVQQGGPAGYGTNKVYIGWATDGSGLLCQVDNTNFRRSWPISITGTATTAVNQNASQAVHQIGDIGAAYVDWDTTAAPAVQLDTPNSKSAYMLWRATRWGARHVAAMHVYEGNMVVTMSVGNLNNFTWDGAGNFTAAGNVTAYSDIRLKTDITKITDALSKVFRLNGYTYTRKDTGERQTGVVAQEVQKVLPEAVMDTGEHLSVAYGNMVGLLIEAIKELKAEVDQLKGK